MVFSTNQVRQLYVVKATTAGNAGFTSKGTDAEGNIYFKHTNALGTPVRSDLINPNNILSVTTTTPEQGRTPIKSVKVVLDSNINEGKPVAGQDYILNISIRNYIGMSDTDIYVKQGVVRATTGMEAPEFYNELACSLFRNFVREPYPIVKFELAGEEVALVKNNKDTGKPEAYKLDTNGEYVVIDASAADSVIITEVEQEWRLGVKEQVPVYFTVQPTEITYDGDDVIWGKVSDLTPAQEDLTSDNSYGNGHKIADLEYFCMGERADMYRGIGWPHNLETKYLVDPSKEYYTVNIHYAYVGSNESVQKSEKDITLVCDTASTLNNLCNGIPFFENLA